MLLMRLLFIVAFLVFLAYALFDSTAPSDPECVGKCAIASPKEKPCYDQSGTCEKVGNSCQWKDTKDLRRCLSLARMSEKLEENRDPDAQLKKLMNE